MMAERFVRALAGLVLLIGACGPEEVATGGIEGRVVDAEGTPLSDILVQLETASFYGSSRTGEDGVFSAPELRLRRRRRC